MDVKRSHSKTQTPLGRSVEIGVKIDVTRAIARSRTGIIVHCNTPTLLYILGIALLFDSTLFLLPFLSSIDRFTHIHLSLQCLNLPSSLPTMPFQPLPDLHPVSTERALQSSSTEVFPLVKPVVPAVPLVSRLVWLKCSREGEWLHVSAFFECIDRLVCTMGGFWMIERIQPIPVYRRSNTT